MSKQILRVNGDEYELKIARRATELLKDVKPPKERFAAIKTMSQRGSDPGRVPDA